MSIANTLLPHAVGYPKQTAGYPKPSAFVLSSHTYKQLVAECTVDGGRSKEEIMADSEPTVWGIPIEVDEKAIGPLARVVTNIELPA